MRSAAVFVAFAAAAAHAVTAQVVPEPAVTKQAVTGQAPGQSSPSNLPVRPKNAGALPDDHVAKTNPDLISSNLVNSACFQNSLGQAVDESQHNDNGDFAKYKYPCISEQEIMAYCSDKYNTVEDMRACLFDKESSFKVDHVCCIACRVRNSDGREGTKEQAEKFVDALEEKYKSATEFPPLQEMADMVKGELNIVPISVPNTNTVINGVADINILSYCPVLAEKKIVQQAAPVPAAGKKAGPAPAADNSTAPASQTDKAAASTTQADKAAASTAVPNPPAGRQMHEANITISGGKATFAVADNGMAQIDTDCTLRITVNMSNAAPCSACGNRAWQSRKSTSIDLLGLAPNPKSVKLVEDPKQAAEMLNLDTIDCGCVPAQGLSDRLAPIKGTTQGNNVFVRIAQPIAGPAQDQRAGNPPTNPAPAAVDANPATVNAKPAPAADEEEDDCEPEAPEI